MRSEQEVKDLKEELEKLAGFIGEHGTAGEFDSKDVQFSCNVSDTLAWVLEEILTDFFKTDAYINLERLRQIAIAIEIRTGKKLSDYK